MKSCTRRRCPSISLIAHSYTIIFLTMIFEIICAVAANVVLVQYNMFFFLLALATVSVVILYSGYLSI